MRELFVAAAFFVGKGCSSPVDSSFLAIEFGLN